MLRARRDEIDAGLIHDQTKYLLYARTNYFAQQVLVWGSLLASGAAALLGLLPSHIDKAWVGLIAAVSAGLIGASRQLGFQQKANWHYRKADRLAALRRRLQFEGFR